MSPFAFDCCRIYCTVTDRGLDARFGSIATDRCAPKIAPCPLFPRKRRKVSRVTHIKSPTPQTHWAPCGEQWHAKSVSNVLVRAYAGSGRAVRIARVLLGFR